MSFGTEAALLFKINADSSQAQAELKRLQASVKNDVAGIISAFPGGQFLSPFFKE